MNLGKYNTKQIDVIIIDGQCYIEFKETEDVAEFEVIDAEKRKEIRYKNE